MGHRKSVLFLFYLALCLAPGLRLFAQTYPVTATTILIPPYSGYLPDYSNPGSNKLKLLLTFNDFTKPAYNVKIKFSLSGQNITIQSKPFYYYGPVTLYPGVPLELSGEDLSQILNDNNLTFSGISYADYSAKKVLPEGFYSLCFTVYDNDNPQAIPISQQSCAFAWMTHCDPPFLNFPQCGTVIPVAQNNSGALLPPQQITFSWSASSAGCPSSITNTEYLFELYEIFPANQNPNNIIQTSAPIYTLTTQQTILNYGITEPPLQFGRSYCWRVKASDINGYDYFKNNGWSQVCSFNYGSTTASAASSISLSLNAQPFRYNAAQFSWSPNTALTSYRVEYRKTGNSNFSWFGISTPAIGVVASDLEEQTQYEARLRGDLPSGDTTAWSSIVTFTTPAKPQISCNDQWPSPSMQNFSPLTSLAPYTKLQIGQFEMMVTSLQNQFSNSGQYSGIGHITMLGGFNIHVSFTNILVGNDLVVYQGEIKALSDGVQAWQNNLINEQFGGNNTGDVVTGNTQTDGTVSFNISSISLDTTGSTNTIIVTGTNGETETIYVPEVPATIIGGNGLIFYVTENGESGVAGQQGFMPPLNADSMDILSSKGIVNFSAAADQYWGFDSWRNNFSGLTNVEREYQLLQHPSGSYYVPQKSIRSKGFDFANVAITLNDQAFTADSVLFVSSKGTRFFTKNQDGNKKLLLCGGPADDAQVIYALIRGDGKLYSLGKIKISSYELVKHDVVIVPVIVNGQTVSSDNLNVNTKVRSMFRSACVKLNMTVAEQFNSSSWDLNGDGKLQTEGSGMLSQYNSEMKALNTAYRQANNVLSSNLYLFALPAGSSADVAGEMPRSRQFGYLFMNNLNNANTVTRTIVHEIGHGAFKLLHPFDGSIGFTEGASGSVMDYSNDTLLYKFQWDQIHDPSVGIALFDEDGEGQNAVVANIEVLNQFKNADGSLTFLALSGIPITLSGNITKLMFQTPEDEWKLDGVGLAQHPPIGTLYGFILDGAEYKAVKNSNGVFLGYRNKSNNAFFHENKSYLKTFNNVLVGLPCWKSPNVVFKIFPTDYYTNNANNISINNSNDAAGPEKSQFFLDNYLTRINEAVEVYASMRELSDEEVFFLNSFDREMDLCGKNALYAFNTAYVIHKNPHLCNCLKDASADASSQVHQAIINTSFYSQSAPSSNTTNVTVSSLNDGICNVSWARESEVYEQSFNNISTFQQSNLFQYFNQVIEKYYQTLSASSGFTSLVTSDMTEVLKFFEIENTKGRTCLLRKLPWSIRKNLIEKYSEWTITTSKESFLCDLIETTPDADIGNLISFLSESNYNTLWKLYGEINGANIDRFVSLISLFYLQYYPPPTNLANFGSVISAQTEQQLSTLQLVLRAEENYTAGGEYLSHTNKAVKVGSDVEIISKDVVFGQADIPGSGRMYCRFQGTPFDYIGVKFDSDYNLPNLLTGAPIKQGEILVIPSFWVYWLINRVEVIQNWKCVRVVADMAAVAVFIASANPGPLVIMEGVLGAADVGFAIAESSSIGSDPAFQQISDAWNAVYSLCGAGAVVKGGVTYLSKSFTRYSFSSAAITSKLRDLKQIPGKLEDFAVSTKVILQNLNRFEYNAFSLRNSAFSLISALYLRSKVLSATSALDNSLNLTVSANKVVAECNGLAPSIGEVAEQANSTLFFSGLRWFEGNSSEISKVGGRLEDVSYLNKTGVQKIGDLELLILKNGNVWVRELQLVTSSTLFVRRYSVGVAFEGGSSVVEFPLTWGNGTYSLKWTNTGSSIDFGNRSQLATILGSSDNIEAHHISPWSLGSSHDVVVIAAYDGFHLNLIENAIGLEKYSSLVGQGLHGNHPAYDAFVKFRLDNYLLVNSELTPAAANEYLQLNLIPELKSHISASKSSGMNLNEYFKNIVNKNNNVPGY